LAAAAVFAGCNSGGRDSDGLLLGRVTYRERVALPLNAVVELRLEDITQADAPASVLATHALATESRQVPIPFEMRYPPRLIDARHLYGLRAEIRAGNGKLLFTTARHEPVFRDGPAAEFVQLVLLRPAANTTSRTPLPEGIWRLASMRREGESLPTMPGERAYTIEFAGNGTVSGQAHCFGFSGRYTEGDWGQLSISRLAAPTTGCPPPSHADEFLGSLDRVGHHEMRGAQWVLMYGVGGELTFSRF